MCLGGAREVYEVEVTSRVRRVADKGLWGADKL